MELRQVRYFVAIAEELNFHHAADRLQIAQPALSQQIRQLERELGVQLLNRTKRWVKLTDAGRAFLQEARLALIQADRAVTTARRASRGEVGRLAIGFISSSIYETLPPIIREFQDRYPDVRLSLHQLGTPEQVRALRERRIHIGFLRMPVLDGTLRIESVARYPLMVALPERHPLSHLSTVSLPSLAGERFIMYPRHRTYDYREALIRLCADAGFVPKIAIDGVGQIETILNLVVAGAGIALVPSSVQRACERGIIYRPISEPASEVEVGMAWPRDANLPYLSSFLDVVRELSAPAPPNVADAPGRGPATTRAV